MRKFFYDHYTQEDICGMYNLPHFLVIGLFFGLLAVALYFSRRLTQKGVRRMHFSIAIGVLVLEVVKISLRIYKKQPPDDWMPLFYCSLFLFAVWFALCKWEPLKRVGYSYMTMGGVAAAMFYIVYPSTGLGMYPIWHPAALHGMIYHFTMCYTGLLTLIKRQYTPTAKDSLYYFMLVFGACIPSYFLNGWLGCNCMFLSNAFGLPFLSELLAVAPIAYMLVVSMAQSVALFWVNYGLYRLSIRYRETYNEKNKEMRYQ